MRTLVIDNGSYEVKLNWADQSKCMHVQNSLMRSRDRRLWLGNAVDLCKDLIGLQYRRPVDRGQLYSWELQKPIWDWIWDTHEVTSNIDEFKESTLLLTETPGTLSACSSNTDQIIFEEYEFQRYRRCAPQTLASNIGAKTDAKLVIDLGFYATHVVPVFHRQTVCEQGIRRLDVAGKVLTNYLKETISFRYYNMMDESAILNRVKEQTCFTSIDFGLDLNSWHQQIQTKKYSDFAIGYALPSSHEEPYGHVIPSLDQALEEQKSGREQILILENERFSIPEAIFDPLGHLGVEQAGLAEVVADSISACPVEYQPLLWSNIVVCGGTSKLPNFKNRIHAELRKWAPADVPVEVELGGTESAWKGGCQLANDSEFDLTGWTVSRDEYLEQGPAYAAKKMLLSNRWTRP